MSLGSRLLPYTSAVAQFLSGVGLSGDSKPGDPYQTDAPTI